MKSLNRLFFLIFIVLISFSLQAQVASEISSETPKESSHSFGFSLSAGNNPIQGSVNTTVTKNNKTVVNGILPAETQYFITPGFSFSHSCGFYADLSAGYLISDSVKQIDNITLSLGYSKTFFEHLVVGLGYSYGHYLSSTQVFSTLNNTASLGTSWSNSVITPSLGICYNFGETADFSCSGSLSHSFSFGDVFTAEDNLEIPISIGTSFGTMNSYKSYVTTNNKRIVRKVGKKPVPLAPPVVVKTTFGFTAVVFSLGASYSINNFSVTPSISYVKQMNLPAELEANKIPTMSISLGYNF